jgi:hypothetical protein
MGLGSTDVDDKLFFLFFFDSVVDLMSSCNLRSLLADLN